MGCDMRHDLLSTCSAAIPRTGVNRNTNNTRWQHRNKSAAAAALLSLFTALLVASSIPSLRATQTFPDQSQDQSHLLLLQQTTPTHLQEHQSQNIQGQSFEDATSRQYRVNDNINNVHATTTATTRQTSTDTTPSNKPTTSRIGSIDSINISKDSADLRVKDRHDARNSIREDLQDQENPSASHSEDDNYAHLQNEKKRRNNKKYNSNNNRYRRRYNKKYNVDLPKNTNYYSSTTTTDEDSDRRRRKRSHEEEGDDSDMARTMARVKRQTERDPYVFNLFEVLLTTLETKLRRVESMDRALQHLARRMDTFEGSLQHTLNTTNKMIHLIETRFHDSGSPCPPAPQYNDVPRSRLSRPTHPHFELQPQIVPLHPGIKSSNLFSMPPEQPVYFVPEPNQQTSGRSISNNKQQLHNHHHPFSTSYNAKFNHLNGAKTSTKSDDNVEARLEMVAAHISKIDNKLSTLQQQLDSNSLQAATGGGPDELLTAASENYRVDVGLGVRRQDLFKNQDLRNVETAVDRVHESVEALNQRFAQHAAFSGEQIEHIVDNMMQVRRAVIIHGPNSGNTTKGGAPSQEEPRSKLDVLVQKVSPLEEVRKKMDEVWSILVGTKSSVDGLVPKSEALLTNSQRQERAILHIGSDLSEKTDRIIHNLGQVERRLESMPRADVGPSNKLDVPGNSPNPVTLLHRSTNQRHQEKAVTPLNEANIDLKDMGDHMKLGMNFSAARAGPGAAPRSEANLTASVERGGVQSLVLNMVQKKPVESVFLTPSVNDDTMGYSCSDLMKQGHTESGNYHIRIRGTTYWFLKVNCDMEIEGGGWTVIQRRDDFGDPRENFNRDWTDYKHGFGNPDREFYLGNENIYLLTNTQEHIMRVELEDFEGNRRYAEYSTFKLHSELDLYKLEIGGYTGNAGNSLNDPWYGSNLSPFSTRDRDNDRSSLNCASMLKGGWWWRSCGRGLNGLYLTNPNDYIGRQGIVWFRWRGWDYSLKKSLIMIRPKTHTAEPSKTKNKRRA